MGSVSVVDVFCSSTLMDLDLVPLWSPSTLGSSTLWTCVSLTLVGSVHFVD